MKKPEKKPAPVGTNCEKCRKRVVYHVARRGPGARVAIRCAYCMRVFCLSCAIPHFGVERDDRHAALIAQKVAAKIAQIARGKRPERRSR